MSEGEKIYKEICEKYIKSKYEFPTVLHIDKKSFLELRLEMCKYFSVEIQSREIIEFRIERGDFDSYAYILGMTVKILKQTEDKVIIVGYD